MAYTRGGGYVFLTRSGERESPARFSEYEGESSLPSDVGKFASDSDALSK